MAAPYAVPALFFSGRGAIVDRWSPPRGTAGPLCSPSGPQGNWVIVPAELSEFFRGVFVERRHRRVTGVMQGAPGIQAMCGTGTPFTNRRDTALDARPTLQGIGGGYRAA